MSATSTQFSACRRSKAWRMVLLLALSLAGFRAGAQNAAQYIFTASSGTLTYLSGGTPVTAIHGDDSYTSNIPIGFSFNFCGTSYNTVSPCSNGWISFVTATSSNLTNGLPYVSSITPALMPLWDDLGGQTVTGQTVQPAASYLTTGTQPNRVFTFEYKNWRWTYQSQDNITIQVKLFEGTNIIQYIYKQESTANTLNGATIGIAKSNTDYQALNNSTATPISSSTAMADNITTRPATGQIYQWAPPPPCNGVPVGGTAVANPAAVCPNSTTTLVVTGATVGTGLTYQWEQWNGTAWINVIGGVGATTNTYTTAALTTSMQYRLKITCNTNPTTPAYSAPVTTTINNFGPPPYLETFESITANNQLPNCMTATNLNNYTYTYTAPTGGSNQINHTAGGSKYASFRWGTPGDWFFTPALTLTAGQQYLVRFWYITDGISGWTSLKASMGTANNATAMTIPVGTPLSNVNNTTYQLYTGIVTAPTSGPYYIGVNCQATTQPNYLTIDDISVDLLPPCTGTPVAGTITPSSPQNGCPGTSYNITTTGTSVAANLSYQWLQSTTSNPAWLPVTGGSGGTTQFYTTPPLSDTIRYRLKVTCNNSSLSDTTAPLVFNVTPPVYAGLPFTESFESWVSRCSTSDVPSLSWTNTPFTGNTSWRRNDQGSTANWTSPTTGAYTPAAAVGTYSARYHAYYGDANNGSNLSAYVNCSGGNPGSKELRFFMRNYPSTSIYPGDSLRVFLSTDGGANFSQLATYGATGGSWVAQTLILNSSAPKTVIRFQATSQYQYYGDLGLDHVQILGACAGKPTAGSITPVLPCANQQFTLTTTGTTVAAGLNYQWQRSGNGIDWLDVTPNGTAATLDQTINTPTWYRMILKCVNGNQADTTAPYFVQLQNFYVCYCGSNATVAATNEDIGNVTIKTQPANVVLLNNGVGTPVANNTTAVNAYTNFTGLTPPMLIRDSTYNFSVQQISAGSNSTSRVAIYLDYNRDGVFQTSELILSQATTAAGNWNVNGNFTIPSTAGIGITGMRVILWRGTTVPPPCGPYASNGETEDYLVNISYRPCTGPSNPGTVFANTLTTCVGYPIDLGDTTYEKQYSRLTRTWQISTNGGVTWQQIPNSLNKDTLQDVIITGPSQFRVRMVCHATNDTTYSTALSIGINPPYACYCYSMANGGFLKRQDTSDVGMFRIGNYVFNTGGPHLQNPESWRRRTDYTAPPDIELYADSTYGVDVYHILRRTAHADAKITLFMDFNNNLQYDIPQERVWTAYSTASNWYVTGNIAIPHSVVPQTPTGMRLIINNNTGPNVPSDEACGTYVSGETEDYVVMFRYANKLGLPNANQNLMSLALFPNPTDGRFTVSYTALNSVKHADLTVTNMTGQQLIGRSFDGTGASFSTELDLTQFAKGVYFVELRADGEKLVRKLVVR